MNTNGLSTAKEAERICNERAMADPAATAALMEQIRGEHVRREVMFGGAPIPTLPRPCFITPEQERMLRAVTGTIMSCLEKVVKTYFESDLLHDVLRLSEMERRMVAIDPGLSRCVLKARLDAFMDGLALRFVEFNCDSPAAVAYGEVQCEIFHDTDIVRALLDRFELTWYNRSRMMYDTLIGAYREFGGKEEHPHIAITDWRDIKTIHEFRILKGEFEKLGCPTTIIDPREFELSGDRLIAGGGPVDIVYRRVIIREALEKESEIQPFLTACRRRLACVVNPFRSKVVSNKSTLAVLTDRRFDRLFTDEENEIKRRHIPWTRNLLPGRVDLDGAEHDVFALAAARREEFVIKPCDGYGGQGVALGRETTEGEWDALLNRAAAGGWVLQKYVDIPEEDFPIVDDGVKIEKRKVNLNPFAVGGHYGGCICRVSKASIINVSAGGGMVPTFAAWPRE